MKRVLVVLIAGLFIISTPIVIAAGDFDASIPAEKRAYYAEIERAEALLESGGELTPEQNELLKAEGIIHSPTDEVDEMGGPDAFGYRYIDSQEDGGPVYDWIDITDTGIEINNMGDDTFQGPFNLPFTFNYYGNDYDQVYICSNGFLMFGGGSGDLGNDPIPNAGNPNNIVCFFWDDLNPADVGSGPIWYGEDEDGNWVCTFDDVEEYGGTNGHITCQTILYPSGNIIMQYAALDDGIDINGESIGIENSTGTIGLQVSYNTTPAAYPFAELAIKFWTFEAFINGTVTDDNTGLPIEDVEVNLYLTGEEESLATVFTNEDGEYSLTAEEEGTYIVTAYAPGYVLQTSDDIPVEDGDELTQDFALLEETNLVEVQGYVYSADVPDTPLQGVFVSMPQLGIFDATNINGYFNLGDQLQGEYTFEVGHFPIASGGYHDLIVLNVLVSSDEMPLQFDLFEIMPTTDLSAMAGNEQVTLSWTAPANHPEEFVLAEIQQELQGLRATLEQFSIQGAPDERSKIPFIETEIHRLEAMEKIVRRGQDLDELTDFMGFRVKLYHPEVDPTILPDYIQGTNFTVTDLNNGTEYGFQVAADYGYEEDYWEWSQVVITRPLPVGDYIIADVEYDWIEINPANGGEGNVAIDFGDDNNSGAQSFNPLTFSFFGENYNQFGACTNGWFSFTNFTSGTIGPTLPNPNQPNATVVVLNTDTHAGGAGDGMGIWYLVDEENNQVIIQFYLRPYSGFTEYRYSYQAVLDCDEQSLTFNYETADDWMYYNRGGAIVGIEDENGEVGYTYAMSNITDESSIKFLLPDWEWGGINATVLDQLTGLPIEGASAVATDSEGGLWSALADENGYLTVLVNTELGPWDIDFGAMGYYSTTVEGITIPEEEFDVTIDDIELDGVPIGYNEDFEDEEQVSEIWVVSENNIPGDWEWGIPTAGPMSDHTADGENCWATNLEGNHGGPPTWGALRGDSLWTTETWYVGSEDAIVTYWHWHDYYVSGASRYNGYNFQISTDGGLTWEIITPIDGYSGTINYLAANGSPGEVGFGGTTDGWEQVAFPIGDYIGDDVKFMFHAGAYYWSTYYRYGVAIDDFKIHGVPVPGAVEGIVTDADTGDPLENAEITLRLQGEEYDFTLTDETGYYFIDRVIPTDFNPEDYTIDCIMAQYIEQMITDVYMPEGETITVDIEMVPQTTTVGFDGHIMSADTPDTPVPNATVTIPQLEISTVTDETGYFDLGENIIGTYTFEITYENPEPYHFQNFYNIPVNEETVPLELFVSELMPPENLNVTIGNGQATMTWSPPANALEDNLAMIEQGINNIIASIEEIQSSGNPMSIAKLPEVERELFRYHNWRDRLRNLLDADRDLDELADFVGYRIKLDDEIQDVLVENNSYTVTGLDNGHEYTFYVAADYGYGDEYLVFTDGVVGRPLPAGNYVIVEDVEYQWIEINPANGGEGTVAIDFGDDNNSGAQSFNPLAFNFFGENYSQFGACTNGWFSFTNFTSGTIGPTLPNPSQPNATVVVLNTDTHAGNAGDGMGIWYLVDEENNQVIIQFYLRPWSGNTNYRYSYQAVLDCDEHTLTFNYETADDWMYYATGGAVVGIEDENGVVGYTYAMQNITNEMSLFFDYMADFGNVVGTVTTIVDEEPVPVEGAYVFLNESPLDYGISDENGYYEILLVDPDDGPYTVVCHADGYEHAEEGGVDWENQEFDQVVDFMVEEISARTPPYVITWDGYNDDGIDLVMGEPGVYEHLLTGQYDDGRAADAWVLNEEGPAIWAVPFEVSGQAYLVQTELRLASPEGPWGYWPDDTANPVTVRVYADNEGLPGEILFASEPVIPDDGLVIIQPALKLQDRFWVGMTAGSGSEAICVDAVADHGSLLYYSIDGADWLPHNADGDPLVRVDLYTRPFNTLTDHFEVVLTDYDPEGAVATPVAATYQSPVYGFVPPITSVKQSLQPGWSNGVLFDELDEFLGFNVYYSTDEGENYTMHNVDPIEDDTYMLNLGSDLEDTDLLVYLTATVDSSGEIIETDPSLTHEMIFNMSPSAPEDLDVVNVNHPAQTATLSWDIPTDNADGSLLIDLEDYELYRGGTHIATVTVDEGNTYAEQVVDAGYFTYKIVARDEVGNSSDTTYSEVTRIGDPPFWTSFEPDAEPEQPNPFETDGVTWEWGAPLINPDGGYDGTAYCWNTVVNGNYMPSLDEYLVSTHAWNVISDFYLIYYHWTNFAGGDGYNLQISTDLMETWEIVQPTTNYPGQFGLASEPGFTGSSNGWQMVEFDLSQFNDADSVYIQFHLGSNANDNGPGVAIDNLEIWGVPREARGCVEGFVFDHQDQPMEGARVFVEDLPFFQAFTNQEGHYFLLNAPAGDENNVVCEYPFYWPCVAENFEIIERDTVSLDFTNESGMPLLYPDGELETTSLEVFVNINEEVGDTTGTGLIELESIGSGPLAWNAYVRVIEGPNLAGIGQGHHPVNPEQVFSGPKNRRSGRQLRKSLNMVGPTLVDPGPDGGSCISDNTLDELWNPLLSFNAQTQAGNTGIVSAVTTSDRIYVSAVYMDDETSDNILYEYNHAGDLFMSYAYPVEMLGVSGYGPIDIAHDPLTGDLIGCNADGEIYRFAPDMTTYELLPALVNFSPTAIAYDWDADLLYLREWGNEFVAVDPLSGDVADLDTEPTGESVIGMGYMPLDDQGYTIWLMAQNADGQGGYVYRYNPLTTEYDLTMTEVYTPAEGSAAGGMEISNGWRSDFWDITTVYQTTMDLVDVWEGIFSPPSWVWVSPSEDTLQPGEILNVEIHADMRDVEGYDLVEGTEIAAEIIFNGSYWANPPTVDLTITIINDDVAGEEAATPDRYALHQNYPNPFNPLTLIRFDLVEAQEVKLMVYNVLGREVARLVDERLEAGYHNIRFNAEGLASGVYFYRIESPAFNNMKKMVLVK